MTLLLTLWVNKPFYKCSVFSTGGYCEGEGEFLFCFVLNLGWGLLIKTE